MLTNTWQLFICELRIQYWSLLQVEDTYKVLFFLGCFLKVSPVPSVIRWQPFCKSGEKCSSSRGKLPIIHSVKYARAKACITNWPWYCVNCSTMSCWLLLSLNKSLQVLFIPSIIFQARTFNETPINPRKCVHILTKILYLVNQVCCMFFILTCFLRCVISRVASCVKFYVKNMPFLAEEPLQCD